jgi:DNA transformation protein
LDAEGLKELFTPFGAVTVKRMFGGHGIYADGLCFAIESRGEIFVKVDADNEAEFLAAGSKPFVYEAKGKRMSMAYWLLVARAYDDEDELRRWADLGLGAAHRGAEAKAKRVPRVKKAR